MNQLTSSYVFPRITRGFELRVGSSQEPGDLQILSYIYRYRVLDLTLLQYLTGRTYDVLKRRIRKLTAQKYLSAVGGRSFEKKFITIGTAALPLLVKEQIAPLDILTQRIRTNELSEFFIRHEVGISFTHGLFELASRRRSTILEFWHQGKPTWDEVKVSKDGQELKYPIRPDAFFSLSDGKNQHTFYLEFDRGTPALSRFRAKAKGYYYFLKHTADTSGKRFKVLTLSQSRIRALHLAQATSELFPKSTMFLFADFDQLSLNHPERIYAPLYISPRDVSEHYQVFKKRHPNMKAELAVRDTLTLMDKKPVDSWNPLMPPLTNVGEENR